MNIGASVPGALFVPVEATPEPPPAPQPLQEFLAEFPFSLSGEADDSEPSAEAPEECQHDPSDTELLTFFPGAETRIDPLRLLPFRLGNPNLPGDGLADANASGAPQPETAPGPKAIEIEASPQALAAPQSFQPAPAPPQGVESQLSKEPEAPVAVRGRITMPPPPAQPKPAARAAAKSIPQDPQPVRTEKPHPEAAPHHVAPAPIPASAGFSPEPVRPPTPAQALAPVAMEPPAEATPAAVKSLTLRIGGDVAGNPVLRLTAAANGDVDVAIRTLDPRLHQLLRSQLPELAQRLEQAGVSSEFWASSSSSMQTAPAAEQSATPQDPQHQNRQQELWQEASRQRHSRHNRALWDALIESRTGKDLQ